MFSHLYIRVENYTQACNFYAKTLSVLIKQKLLIKEFQFPPRIQDGKTVFPGIKFTKFIDIESVNAFCIQDLTYGIKAQPTYEKGSTKDVHFAFKAQTKELIHAWYVKALQLGAKDNGAPGPRDNYNPAFYGAFVVDPSGYRIEACLGTYLITPLPHPN